MNFNLDLKKMSIKVEHYLGFFITIYKLQKMLHNENLQRFSNVILVLPENFRKTQRFIPDINTETKA